MIDDPVRIVEADVQPFCLRLSRPWQSARGVLHRREGWLIRLVDAEGISGMGECGPMPEAGTESAARAGRSLGEWSSRLPGRTVAQAWEDLESDGPGPAARCALESALLTIGARRKGLPIARLLNPAAPSVVQVSGNIGIADDGLSERAANAVRRGFGILKVKLGIGEPRQERRDLRRLLEDLPEGILLRLDANGAWDAGTAADWLDCLAGMPVESLEEPVSDPDPAVLETLQARASFALALDESLPKFISRGLTSRLPVRRLVVKPMVLGGLCPALGLAATGSELVVTTTVDAAPGRWMAAHLAAALDSGLAHGLDTGGWLAEDVGSGPVIDRGRCRLFG